MTKWVATLDLQQLIGFMKGMAGDATPRDALQALDIALRHAAMQQPNSITVGKSMYFSNNACPLGQGVEV
jgi:hypothetical protein